MPAFGSGSAASGSLGHPDLRPCFALSVQARLRCARGLLDSVPDPWILETKWKNGKQTHTRRRGRSRVSAGMFALVTRGITLLSSGWRYSEQGQEPDNSPAPGGTCGSLVQSAGTGKGNRAGGPQ